MKNKKESIENDFDKQRWLKSIKKTNKIFNEAKEKEENKMREVKNDNK